MISTNKTKNKNNLEKTIKSKKTIDFFENAIYFVFGFILTKSTVLDSFNPFAISLISVSKKENLLFSIFGSLFGYLIFSPNDFARYSIAIVIASLGCFSYIISDLKRTPLMPMVISFLSLCLTGVIVDLKNGSIFSEYALTFAESLIGLSGSFFFFKAINCNFKRFKFKALPLTDLTSLLISFSILIMSLSNITIKSISIVRIIAILLILISIRFGSDKFSLILSLSFGFTFGIAKESLTFIVGAYGFSTLVGILFSPLGKIGSSLSFLMSVFLFSIPTFDDGSNFIVIETLIASLIFIFLPSSINKAIESCFQYKSDASPDGSLRQSLVVRLRFASNAMSSISECVNDVREKIKTINEKNLRTTKQTKSKEEYLLEEIINQKTNELRMIASDQFFSISDMLLDLAKEFDNAEHFDNVASGKIRRMLSEYEVFPKNISVIEDKFSKIRVEIITKCSDSAIAGKRIQTEISKICNRYFEKGRVTHFKDEIMVSFIEKPNYSIKIGFAQHSAEGTLCGDTIKTLNDSRGHAVLIISDGMGRGNRAALDGAMGAGLLSKLLTAGFGFDSALKVVNSALLVKSNEESLATLDCAEIDLFSGKVDFYKAGAPASFIVKGEKVLKCELSSMPAGILRGIEFAKRTSILTSGDILIMTSDGITDLGTSWLNALATGFEDMEPQKIADEILKNALNIAKDIKEDDMSVIVAKLSR